MDKRKKRSVMAAIIVVLIVLVTIPVIRMQSGGKKLDDLLKLGEKYLEDMQYESAIAVFDEAIAIEPKCAEAYLGKAKAQYALELYQDAIETLRTGIGQVEDPTELEAFLQQILDELSAKNEGEPEPEEEIRESEVIAEEVHTPIKLNYKQITRRIDTEDPEIQLEVLGDHDEKYIWESSDPECATVSDTGLVTCQPVAGYSYISVTTEEGKDKGEEYYDYCEIYITTDEQSESVRVAIDDGNDNQKQYLVVKFSETEDGQMAEIIHDVYYSGDVLIPEQLTYHDETIPITNISYDAFSWSYEMKSVFIPAFVESIGESEYYSPNPFGYCLNLEEIRVDEENTSFQVADGVLYSKDGKKLIAYPAAKAGQSYTVPQEVEMIFPNAFTGCKNLETILVEEGNPFYESVEGALVDKRAGELIAYPAGNKRIRYTVPENVTTVAEGVFYGSCLEDIVCRSVEYVYFSQFLGCEKLKRIECGQGTRLIDIPIYEDIHNIELAGFEAMQNLEDLTIPLCETQDINDFAHLQGLKRLSMNANERVLDLKVLGTLKNLTDLQIIGMDHVKDISWLSDLEYLESVYFNVQEYLDESIDFNVLKELKNVERLDIWGIGTLSDISWLSGMENLRNVSLYMERAEIEDLSPLLELDNLYSVSFSSQESMENEEIMIQAEHIKAEKPEVSFYIFE